MTAEKRTCEDCRHCVEEEYGYSMYTVEGVSVSCSVDAHPEGSFDRGWSDVILEPKLLWAEQCSAFEEGKLSYVSMQEEEGECL